MEVTLGGERLGAGKRNKVQMHNYQRSNHDIGYVWRSTMSAGTLVPFMVEPALPGDTLDIDLNCEILTHPTIGPLFGTYSVQLDVFQVPVRLYQAALHMNMLGIGLDMSQVKLPQVRITGQPLNPDEELDNQQINPSCIFSYLNIRGTGFDNSQPTNPVTREFNAIPYLAYWDIYKNYYANKQEEQGAVIHKNVQPEGTVTITTAELINGLPTPFAIPISGTPPFTYTKVQLLPNTQLQITGTGIEEDEFQTQQLFINIQQQTASGPIELVKDANDIFTNFIINEPTQTIIASGLTQWAKQNADNINFGNITYQINEPQGQYDYEPQITFFPLDNIDDMRMSILSTNNINNPFIITASTSAPYGLPLASGGSGAGGSLQWAQQFSQEGLALKTYKSDLFNNWISTEWIDGADGISAITAIDTSGGSFTIDELNLSKKIYDMLNRIAISGGSYDDWLDAVYTHERNRSAENPMYIGGLMKNIVFQEVISSTPTEDYPLGTLAGRGRMGQKHKGGQIVAKIDEPSYIIGIISITPLIDYSQGNKWDTNLKTMNDFHKPALDQIGFQDLITDQMAWWDTPISAGQPQFKSAGKQPAWINYMTNVNQVRGNFADPANQMWMTLNRRYEPQYDPTTGLRIRDLTTYIDPVKFNQIFAQTSRDAQNFWAQIGINISARRKMSAKVMPNL